MRSLFDPGRAFERKPGARDVVPTYRRRREPSLPRLEIDRRRPWNRHGHADHEHRDRRVPWVNPKACRRYTERRKGSNAQMETRRKITQAVWPVTVRKPSRKSSSRISCLEETPAARRGRGSRSEKSHPFGPEKHRGRAAEGQDSTTMRGADQRCEVHEGLHRRPLGDRACRRGRRTCRRCRL